MSPPFTALTNSVLPPPPQSDGGDAGFFFIPDDPSNLAAGGVSGTFKGPSIPAHVTELLHRAALKATLKNTLRNSEWKSLEGKNEEKPSSKPPKWMENQDLLAFLNETIELLDVLGTVEEAPSPFAGMLDRKAVGPPVALFRVTRVKKGQGMRVGVVGFGGVGPSVWVKSAVASRFFKKRDQFLMGWDDECINFIPPSRKSWRGWAA